MRAVDHQRDAYNDIKIEWKTSIYNVGTTARLKWTPFVRQPEPRLKV
jgi:hypothetical protein